MAVGYPGVPGAPGQQPKDTSRVEGEVMGQNADSMLIRTKEGDIVVTDDKGRRRK